EEEAERLACLGLSGKAPAEIRAELREVLMTMWQTAPGDRCGKMSRSRRKNPICGITTAQSEKQNKREYNRRFRRATRQALRHFDTERDVLPHLREHSDPWAMDKDGKQRFDPKAHPDLMRK